jgi:membrane fusion protein (multidrug efflux system)
VRARVQFANPDGLLRPGLTGTLRVRNADTGPQLTIPYKAVTEQMGEFYVFVVGDSNKVARRGIPAGHPGGGAGSRAPGPENRRNPGAGRQSEPAGRG